MANSVMSFTETKLISGSVKKVKCVWLSDDANGTCVGNTSTYYDGQIIGAITIPGAGTPANSYDIAVYDSDSVDVALGSLFDRSNVTTQYINGSAMAGLASSVINVQVTNAGNAKNGTLYLYIR